MKLDDCGSLERAKEIISLDFKLLWRCTRSLENMVEIKLDVTFYKKHVG